MIVYQSADDEDNQDIFGDAHQETDPIVLIIYIDTQTKASHDVFDLLAKKIKELSEKEEFKRGGSLNVEKKSFELGQIHVKFSPLLPNNEQDMMKDPEEQVSNAYATLLLFESAFKKQYIGGIEKVQKVYPT